MSPSHASRRRAFSAPRTFAPASFPVSRPSPSTSSSVARTASKRRRSAIGRTYDPQRGGDDHQAVPLGPVPVDAVDRVGAQVAPHDVEGEGPAQLVEPLGVVSREDPPDDVGLHRVAPLRAPPPRHPDAARGDDLGGGRGTDDPAQERHEVVARSRACRRSRTRRRRERSEQEESTTRSTEGSERLVVSRRSVRSGSRRDRRRSSAACRAGRPPSAA